MAQGAEGVPVAYPLFQAEGGGSTPTSALDLCFYRLANDRQGMATAVQLNRLWHSRLPVIRKGCLTAGVFHVAECGGAYYAVAIWTHPISYRLPQGEWLELRRFAISPDAPRNTASRMLGWMARDLAKREPHLARLISYQDVEVHTGTIYKAAGWVPTRINPETNWHSASRERVRPPATGPKQRWEKVLRATNQAPAREPGRTEGRGEGC